MSQDPSKIAVTSVQMNEAGAFPGKDFFSPRKFLQARRPERFSDSVVIPTASLDRSQLEYQLDSLTSRKQETDFERLAKRLIERTICPNLTTIRRQLAKSHD